MASHRGIAARASPPRRRVHRPIRSCWDCKRRKVRCQLSTEDLAACSSCVKKGISCRITGSSQCSESLDEVDMGKRLARAESLLEKLLAHKPTLEAEICRVTDFQDTVLEIPSRYISSNLNADENAHYLKSISSSVFDIQLPSNQPCNSKNHIEFKQFDLVHKSPTGLDALRKTLSGLLPTQDDADIIWAATRGWALVQVLCTPSHELFRNQDLLSSFNLPAVLTRHPTVIARTLLYIAICIQQLPPEFDASQLQHISSHDTFMEQCNSTVTALVTSDDELVSTIEGVECLLLQALYQINAGNLKKAWLCSRRALNTAQLMGFDKGFEQSRRNDAPNSIKPQRRMWHQVVMTDRYVSMLLGLRCGTDDDCFGLEEALSDGDGNVDLIFQRRTCIIAGRINKRNQAHSTDSYIPTQAIVEDVERLRNETPQSWWNIPRLDASERSVVVAQQFDRLLNQIWFFQLESFLHLPFMLRTPAERRFEYSKHMCLRALRELLLRYLALRQANNTQVFCRVVDFAAFAASVMMILTFLQDSQVIGFREDQQERIQNMALVRSIIEAMESLSKSGSRELIARQSVEVLKILLGICDSSESGSRNLRLTIPYFGTIYIVYQAPSLAVAPSLHEIPVQVIQNTGEVTCFPTSQTQPNLHQIQDEWQDPILNNANLAYVSFTSTHFPSLELSPPVNDWPWEDADTQFFDGMLFTDIGGQNNA